MEDAELVQHRGGLGILTAALFIVGEMAGAGIVTLPYAMKETYWYGVVILVIACIISGYTGVQLSECWKILQQQFPEYRKQTRKPFPAIAEKAFGPWVRRLLSVSVCSTLFGVSTVYLLLASENIQNLSKNIGFGSEFPFCALIPIIAAVLIPVSLLGTPADFWPVAVLSAATSIISAVLLIVGSLFDAYSDNSLPIPSSNLSSTNITTNSLSIVSAYDTFPKATYMSPTFISLALGYGAMCFFFGGHAAFPTIQHDMRRPSDFKKSVILAYVVVLLMYASVSISGYLVYGELTKPNLIQNISSGWISITVDILICIHLVVSFVIIINPVCQEVEELLGIPHGFGWKRILTRVAIIGVEVFVAESVPRFYIILDLIGSTTITLNTYIVPGIFLIALKLKRTTQISELNNRIQRVATIPTSKEVEKCSSISNTMKKVNSIEVTLTSVTVILGFLGGICGAYAAISAVTEGSFTVPCYINFNLKPK